MIRALAVAAASFLLLTGCGQDTPAPAADPTPTAASPSATPTPSLTATGAAPATGVTLTSAVARVNAPAGWMTNPELSDFGGNVNGPDGNARYNLALGDSQTSVPDESPDYSATLSQKSCCYRPPLERQPDLVLAGQPAYHLAGNDNIFGNWADEYGVRYRGHTVKVIISTPRDLAPAKRESINASILASFELG